jgi:hypothetical protein
MPIFPSNSIHILIHLLATLLVVDLVVPEKGLVAITPWECLVADVEVIVLWALFWWWSMCLVLPVLVPERVCIGAEDDQAWDGDATNCQYDDLQTYSKLNGLGLEVV